MAFGQPPDNAILSGVQVLELIHQYVVPARPELLRRGVIGADELLGKGDQVVEVSQVAGSEGVTVLTVECHSALTELFTLHAVKAELRQRLSTTLGRNAESAQHSFLILAIGNAEAGSQAAALGVVTQDPETDRVQGPAGDVGRGNPTGVMQPSSDLLGGLVGKGHRENPAGQDAQLFDQVLDTVDQAVGFPGSRPRNNQEWAQWCLDVSALLRGRRETHQGAGAMKERAHRTRASATSSITESAGRPNRDGTPKEWSAPSTR